MGTITRRLLFQRASIGVVAAGAIVAAPRLFEAHAKPIDPAAKAQGATAATSAGAPATQSGPVVAYVRDSAKGEIALYVGNREIIRRDPELVARLLQAGA